LTPQPGRKTLRFEGYGGGSAMTIKLQLMTVAFVFLFLGAVVVGVF
jgi:hypothetical protein